MPDKFETLKPLHHSRKPEGKRETFSHRRNEESRKVYQTYAWQKFRKKLKIKQRKRDEQLVHKFYQATKEIPFREYQAWLVGDAPLCAHCLKDKRIESASVADHIKRIERGGAVLSEENIQWLCHYHHNRKSGQERHEG